MTESTRVSKEMHPRDDEIGRQHEFPARRGRKQSRIVAKAERPLPGERRKISLDQLVFGRTGHGGSLHE
jgi:hypothetical protein